MFQFTVFDTPFLLSARLFSELCKVIVYVCVICKVTIEVWQRKKSLVWKQISKLKLNNNNQR